MSSLGSTQAQPELGHNEKQGFAILKETILNLRFKIEPDLGLGFLNRATTISNLTDARANKPEP